MMRCCTNVNSSNLWGHAAEPELNGSESPPLARMDSAKLPSPGGSSPPPRGPSPQPEAAKSSGVGSLLKIRKSRKVSAEQAEGSTSPPPTSKKRFLRKAKKAKDSPEDGTPSASGASTPSITPSPSPKPKKSTKASTLMSKLSIRRNRRRTSPANTDTSEDERRTGRVTPPSMMPPPEEEEVVVEGDQSQRVSGAGASDADVGVGALAPGTPNAPDDSVVKSDMKSEPDLGASEAGGGDQASAPAEGASSGAPEDTSTPPADAPPTDAPPADAPPAEAGPELAEPPASPPPDTVKPKNPRRSQFLSITTPVVAAMQDGGGPKGEEAPAMEHPLEASAQASAGPSAEQEPVPGAAPEAGPEAAPSDKAADLMASARHKLSQSLGAARNEPAVSDAWIRKRHSIAGQDDLHCVGIGPTRLALLP